MRVILSSVLLALAVAGCQGGAIPQPTPLPPPTSPLASAGAPTSQPTTGVGSPSTHTRVEAPGGGRRAALLVAASNALGRGDATGALSLYDQVIGLPPDPAEGAVQQQAILGLAGFRAVSLHLAAGDEEEASDRLERLRSNAADSPFTRLASQLYEQYSMTGDVRAACATVRAQAPAVIQQPAQVLAALGVEVAPATIC